MASPLAAQPSSPEGIGWPLEDSGCVRHAKTLDGFTTADTATSGTVARGIEVHFKPRMPSSARRLQCFIQPTRKILAKGHGFQVGGVTADGDATKVVNDGCIRDWANQEQIRDAVSVLLSGAEVNEAVSLIVLVATPNPARAKIGPVRGNRPSLINVSPERLLHRPSTGLEGARAAHLCAAAAGVNTLNKHLEDSLSGVTRPGADTSRPHSILQRRAYE
jgi:hypothetical protein